MVLGIQQETKKSWPLTPEASEGANKAGAWEKKLQWFHGGRDGGGRGGTPKKVGKEHLSPE